MPDHNPSLITTPMTKNLFVDQGQCEEIFTEIVAAYPLPRGTVRYGVPFNVPQESVPATDITLTFTDIEGNSHYSIPEGGTQTTLDALRTALPYLRHFRKDSIIDDARTLYEVAIDDKLTVHSLTKRKMSGLYYLITLSANTFDDPLKLSLMQRDLDAAGAFDVIFEDEFGRLYLARTIAPCAKMNATFNLPREKHSTVEITLTSVNPLMPIYDPTIG